MTSLLLGIQRTPDCPRGRGFSFIRAVVCCLVFRKNLGYNIGTGKLRFAH